jgi:hypothetical protein
MIIRLLLLAAIISATSIPSAASNMLPEKVDPDTFNIMTLPWVRSVESYRSTTTDMEVDDEGNLYVCGYFENWVNFGNDKYWPRGATTASMISSWPNTMRWATYYGSKLPAAKTMTKRWPWPSRATTCT